MWKPLDNLKQFFLKVEIASKVQVTFFVISTRMRLSQYHVKMHWKIFRGGGWHVTADPPDFDSTNDYLLTIHEINEWCLIYLIYWVERPPLLNVKMVKKSDGDAMVMISYDIDNDGISNSN